MVTRQKYLTKEALERLPHYQYSGVDLSLIYKYALSPLAAFCVDHMIPVTTAPNTITLFGLSWMILSYSFYWYYAPLLTIVAPDGQTSDDDDSYPPRWIFLFNAVAMLVYQNLDNVDGKQARRTQSSSPLGLLFDHGCDAINSTFGSANWIIGMALVPSENLLQAFFLIFGPYALFYISTWEHYHTGTLLMPIFNGPNEGLLGGILLSLTSWWFGPHFWQGYEWQTSLNSMLGDSLSLPFTMRNCDFVITFAMIASLNELVTKSIFVIRRHQEAAAGLLPFVSLAACYITVGCIDVSIWLTSPRTSLHLAMVLYVEMATELMLAHVTEQPFRPWARWHVLPLIALTVVVVAGLGSGHEDLVQSYILFYLCLMSLYLVSKIYHVLREMSDSLGIWCFDIVTPHPNAGKPNSMQFAISKSKNK